MEFNLLIPLGLVPGSDSPKNRLRVQSNQGSGKDLPYHLILSHGVKAGGTGISGQDIPRNEAHNKRSMNEIKLCKELRHVY